MRGLFISFFAFVCFAAAAPAWAVTSTTSNLGIQVTQSIASACPNPVGTSNDGTPDGCAGAQASSTFLNTTFFTSPVNYGRRPPWNVAGVDYPVGPDATSYPAVSSGNLPNCATLSGSTVNINSTPCEIKHLSFTGICLNWNNISSGTITIDNNIFKLTAGCNPGSTYFIGSGPNNGTQQVIFKYNEIDMTYSRSDTACDGSACVTEAIQFTGGNLNTPSNPAVVFEYNYLYNGQGNVMYVDATNSMTMEYNYNYIQDFGSAGSHSDNPNTNGISGSARVLTVNARFNTQSYHNPTNANGTGLWTYGSQQTSNYGVVGGNIENNSMILNYGFTCNGSSCPWGAHVDCCGSGFNPSGQDVSNNWFDPANTYGFMHNISVSATCKGNINITNGQKYTASFSAGSCS